MGARVDFAMMFRPIVVAIALIAAVHAAPTTNDVVPETNFVEGAATSAHASAKQIATEMIQAGSDWTACSELANATRDEVTDAVAAKQDMLDGLDKGCDCAGKGQDEVIRTLDEMNAASSAVKVAETALETASNTQVQLADSLFTFNLAVNISKIVTTEFLSFLVIEILVSLLSDFIKSSFSFSESLLVSVTI